MTPLYVANDIIVMNFDEIQKENCELKAEISHLKQKNKGLDDDLQIANKRNLLLQNDLVEVNERVPEILFIEKVEEVTK